MGKILVVDDEFLNREVIRAVLAESGHELVDAESGDEALRVATDVDPDLVLLDVMMPGTDGFETTRRLKETFGARFVPVVIVTALSDNDSRRRGLAAGADDFLTKPIDAEVLVLRVRNLLTLRQNAVALLERNVELLELQRFKEEMSALLVHDLKSPLTAVLGTLDYAIGARGKLQEAEFHELLSEARVAGNRAVAILDNLVDIQRKESGRLEILRTQIRLDEFIRQAVAARQWQAQGRRISISFEEETDTPDLFCDVPLLTRVIENILDNAMRYTPGGGQIGISVRLSSGALSVEIGNTGPAIPPDLRSSVFEKYGQQLTGIGRMNLGLGLYFCRMAIEAHGGRLWIEDNSRFPTVFCFEVPGCSTDTMRPPSSPS